eukprot:m.152812 g.152812  ORF g.152812 m.152812 type:complete len:1222 (+) comp23416_c0_seq1:49-3714(+)
MHLYALTLQRASQVTQSVHGNFTGTRQQLVAVARGKVLEILRPDQTLGRMVPLLAHEVFGVIRSLKCFRLTGASKDYIVVGSDSGRVVILEYNQEKNTMEQVHCETFGKSGCRRIVPGQYLAVDPKGRAIMIGAMEKQKLVYILNRDAAARLTISSPLEAHKGHTLVFDIIGVDDGFENPKFACLEVDYEEADGDPTGAALSDTQQSLTIYELDLGLNHVVRKQSTPLDVLANRLITVPGGSDGPSGLLVCSEGLITYHSLVDAPPVSIRIPQRVDAKSGGTLIVAHVMHKHKKLMFFIIQTEYGDLFKLTLDVDDDEVKQINLKYFDTVPVAVGLNLLKNGMLFVAAEFGNHALFQVQQLGDNDDEPTFSSHSPPDLAFEFTPRGLVNLMLYDETDSLAPILACTIADLAGEDAPQLYVASGRAGRSSVQTLRHGLEVVPWAVTELPGNPSAVWSVKQHAADPFDTYIVVSFVNATLVLSIGETVEEVNDSGFLDQVPTLCASRVGDDALVQIHPNGIRYIKGGTADKRINEWKPPGKRESPIVRCCVNERQVAIALVGGEIIYFELDRLGLLKEFSFEGDEKAEMPAEVTCMGVGAVPPGLQRSRFLAVGCEDNTVRILSVDPDDCLQTLSMQALPAKPVSLCVNEMAGGEGEQSTLYLNIGLENGVLLKTMIDPATGDLSDTRTRYLGSRPIKLFNVRIEGSDSVLSLSSRPWLSYNYQGHARLTPLSYEPLEYASSFSSDQVPEGIVAIARDSLRILSLERLGAVFNTTKTKLPHTPRKFAVDEASSTLIVVDGDHHAGAGPAATPAAAEMELDGPANGAPPPVPPPPVHGAAAAAPGSASEPLEGVLGVQRAGANHWTGNVRVIDPAESAVLSSVPLDPNEIAVSVATLQFAAAGDGLTYVVVGVVKDMILETMTASASFLYTYKLTGEGARRSTLTLVHKTPVEGIPAALQGFNGRLLAGVGRFLRLYDLGKKKLLRKTENKHIPNLVVDIQSMGHRILVCDSRESFFFVRYRAADNKLVIFADDTSSRWLTKCTLLDYSTAAGVDKFGNFTVVRLPEGASDDVDDDPTGSKALWDRGLLGGASQKVELMANYHIGETALSLQRAVLTPGGSESLVYTTMAGGVGVFLPFTSKSDVDFFSHLEMHLRSEAVPICGRDHLSYRSAYTPVKNVIDGDLCEQYNSLDGARKRAIADDLDRTPAEVSKKLEEIRNRYAF